MTAYAAWNRLFDETIASLRFKVGKKSLAIEPTLNLHAGSERDDPQGRRAGARQDLQGQPAHLHADHQHARQGQGNLRPLARLRRRRATRGTCRTGSSPRWSMRWSRPCAPPIRGCRTATTRSRRAGSARSGLPHWDRNAPLPKVADPHDRLERGASRPCSPPTARSRRDMAAIAERFFDERLDRRAGASRQGARRLRASDRAVGAPLRAAQLPGQAARRDDARARARPRRASGAGGAERRADGADAAHAGRDRERVRRDADLPEAARRTTDKQAAQGDARRQGRGHDQHGGAADRVLHVRAQRPHRAPQAASSPPSGSASSGSTCSTRASGRRSSSSPATRPSGPISRTSSTRRSTSTPMRSAIAW